MIKGLQFLIHHGAAGWMILIAGGFLVLLSIDRLYNLYVRLAFDSTNALDQIRQCVLNKDYVRALQVCNNDSSNPDLMVIKKTIVAAENGREAMKSALTSSVLDVSHACETRLSFLSLIASAATLLGLFGTILGLMTTFDALKSADAANKAQMLSAGISEAMNCTAAGLIIGIGAMVVHTICISKADAIVGKAQKAGLNLITWIEQSEREK
jgi:biopolymer transport protein ExbB